jgi:hypothetical protein
MPGLNQSVSQWDGVSADSLRVALEHVTDCIEQSLAAQILILPLELKSSSSLCLVMTTQSAYRLPVARVFSETLASKPQLSADLEERVSTTVQEAVMNAVFHGSLKIGSHLRDTLNSLIEVHAQIESQLQQELVALSPIEIEAIWSHDLVQVTVRDSGDGYAPSIEHKQLEDNVLPLSLGYSPQARLQQHRHRQLRRERHHASGIVPA